MIGDFQETQRRREERAARANLKSLEKRIRRDHLALMWANEEAKTEARALLMDLRELRKVAGTEEAYQASLANIEMTPERIAKLEEPTKYGLLGKDGVAAA